MIKPKKIFTTIDEYIAQFPPETQKALQSVRQAIQKAAPQAIEAISYQMPTYKLHGNLIHFAGYAHHIGLYPAPSGIEAFKKELTPYVSAKGSVQFPLSQAMPVELVERITAFRVLENTRKVSSK